MGRVGIPQCSGFLPLCLHKCMGVWKSPAAQAGERPIFGVTVADLARDGMVTVTVTGKHAVAALTPRGSWFARTAATGLAEQAQGRVSNPPFRNKRAIRWRARVINPRSEKAATYSER